MEPSTFFGAWLGCGVLATIIGLTAAFTVKDLKDADVSGMALGNLILGPIGLVFTALWVRGPKD